MRLYHIGYMGKYIVVAIQAAMKHKRLNCQYLYLRIYANVFNVTHILTHIHNHMNMLYMNPANSVHLIFNYSVCG